MLRVRELSVAGLLFSKEACDVKEASKDRVSYQLVYKIAAGHRPISVQLTEMTLQTSIIMVTRSALVTDQSFGVWLNLSKHA